MVENFKLISDELGKNKHSRVYILQDNHSNEKIIVKIYEESKIIFYKNETNILKLLNNLNLFQDNNFFIMFKNMNYNPNMFQLPEKIKENSLEFLFYDYLPKLSLFEYVSEYKGMIKETYAKFICYKLLKAIEQLHKINVCHNNIELLNIMFDNDFNLKLIHFSEAKIINEANRFRMNKDLFCLGQVLAKIITKGRFISINYNKNKKIYEVFYLINNRQKAIMEEKIFWKAKNLNLSKEFLDFFHILIAAKKSKELVVINDLLKNEWFKEISGDIQKYENNFKYYFSEIYELIIDSNEAKNKFDIDINDFIDKFDIDTDSNENLINPEVFYDYNLEPNNSDYNNYFKHITYIADENLNQNNIYNYVEQKELIAQKEDDLIYFNNSIGGKKSFFEPQKDNFNYIVINIENNDDKYLKTSVLINFMQNLKSEIKNYYEHSYINLKFTEEKVTSFVIYYEIDETHLISDEIEFLDETFENKIKNVQKFKIKVELIERKKDLDSFELLKLLDKNKKYYLVFSGDCLDKEDFYGHVREIKILSLLLLMREKKESNESSYQFYA